MSRDLTTSAIERQNVLNNPFALREIQNNLGITGLAYNGEIVFLKEQVAEFLDITPRTVDSYLASHDQELRANGYEVLRGKSLQELKILLKESFGNEADFVTKTTALGVFSFRAFLNLAMLVSDGDRARLLRQTILDIVLDTINSRTGGSTKYINQRDEDFVHAILQEPNYRVEFTNALGNFVVDGKFKYPVFTDKIYVSIFCEKSAEYRKVLKLQAKESVRDTFYSEILDLVAAYEYGFAKALEASFAKLGRKLTIGEVDKLFRDFESQPHWKPLVERARVKMASRDLAFRDALHLTLKNYVRPLDSSEFDRFLGEKSMELAERLEQAKDVFIRLKERG